MSKSESQLDDSVDLSLIRSRADLLAAPQGHSGRWLVLNQRSAQYVQVPDEAGRFLVWLTTRSLGATGAEMSALWPTVNVARLEQLNLIELIPASGRRPKRFLLVEFYLTNLFASVWFAVSGWRLIAKYMRGSPDEYIGSSQGARPLLLDEIEVAAQCTMYWPGTRRLCTIIAISCLLMLRRRGMRSEIVVMATADQPDPHAFVVSEGHRVDPSQEQISGPLLRSIGLHEIN